MAPMPAKCGGSYAVDHQFSAIFLHTTIGLELPCTIFAVHCIVNVTPKSMFLLKLLLLAHQFWVTYYSFMINIGTAPVLFFPDIVMYTRGIFDLLNVPIRVQAYLLGTAFAGMILSILVLFAYRHQCILPDTHFMKMRTKKFVVLSALLHMLATVYMVPMLVGEPPQEHSIAQMQQEYADPPCDLWDPSIYVFFHGFSRTIVVYGVIVAVSSNLMFFFIAHSFHTIRQSSSATSKSTRKRQIGFLYALMLMALIPNMLLILPCIVLILATLYSISYNPEFGDLMVCCLSVHGLLSTLTLILSYKPYKTAARKFAKRLTFKNYGPTKKVVQVEISTNTKSATAGRF